MADGVFGDRILIRCNRSICCCERPQNWDLAGRRCVDQRVGAACLQRCRPAWAGVDWALPRNPNRAFWWLALGYFCGLYGWYAVQVHQTKYLLDIGFQSGVAAWAGCRQPAGHPANPAQDLRPDRSRMDMDRELLGFAICYVALIALAHFQPCRCSAWWSRRKARSAPASIMGAVVLEIFGQALRRYLRHLMLSARAAPPVSW